MLRAKATYFPTGPLQAASLAIVANLDLPHGHPSADCHHSSGPFRQSVAHTFEHAPAALGI